jgi:hypothetical protein
MEGHTRRSKRGERRFEQRKAGFTKTEGPYRNKARSGHSGGIPTMAVVSQSAAILTDLLLMTILAQAFFPFVG